jgi:flagellar basal-body rod modification protein FlgD
MILSGTTSSTDLDPNSKAAADATKLNEDLNRFLNLLVTQLKNQDPLDPMDSTEFTSQLVQFASVEQQINTNANIEKMLTLQQASQVADMVNFIGTTVEAKGDEVPLDNGKAEFTYEFASNADDVTITIRDASGLTVFSQDGETSSGKHTFTWDGKSAGGVQNTDGAYTVIVNALDVQGKVLDVDQTILGRVTGAGAEDGIVTLFLGDISTSMEKVLSVKESDPKTITTP